LLNLPLHIAKRYFFSKRKGGGVNLISVISAISLLGYLVGAAALVIVLSVFNGFEQLFTSMYQDFDCDLKITASSGKTIDSVSFDWSLLKDQPEITAYSRVVEENVLLRYNDKQSIATLKGVDRDYVKVTAIDKTIVSGAVDIKNDSVYAIVGQGIAYMLSLDPNDVFKPLFIYVPKRGAQQVINAEAGFNKAAVFAGGVFSAQEEVDQKYVICPIGFTQQLLQREQQITAVEIKVLNPNNVERLKQKLAQQLGERFIIKNRYEQHDSFFKVMKSEKVVSYFILLFILLIAASNTISSLYILAMEKSNDLSVLKSMGITPSLAGTIFVYEGLIIAFFGGGMGIIIGLLLCLLQQEFGLIALQESADIIFTAYPVKIIWTDLVLVLITVMLLGFLTTIYPVRKVKKVVAG
jgi:lipoprotein-releasing system permease protein